MLQNFKNGDQIKSAVGGGDLANIAHQIRM